MLTLPPEELRAFGYSIIDRIVNARAHQRDLPAVQVGNWDALWAALQQPPPEYPQDLATTLNFLESEVLRYRAQNAHPRFFAFVPGPSNFAGVMAQTLAAGFNVFAGSWVGGSGPAVLEHVVLGWLAQLFQLPADSAGGLFMSGGSLANLTALVAARAIKLREEDWPRGVVYCSDQTHFAATRAARIIGLARHQLRVLPADEHFRLPLAALQQTIAADRAAGLIPFCLVANAGTTNTGAIDPLPELADLCAAENLWLHADGAYGAAAIICDEGRAALQGLERADSIAIDPHKWLFQPIGCGCLLVRNREHLREAFHVSPEYLRDAKGPMEEGSFWNYGPELTRPFRALQLWLTLQVFGLAELRNAVARGFVLTDLAEKELRQLPDWEIVTTSQMAVVTFRYAPAHLTEAERDTCNQNIARAMLADGYAAVLSTSLRGRTVLRLCPINPRTTDDEIRETVRRLAAMPFRPESCRSAG